MTVFRRVCLCLACPISLSLAAPQWGPGATAKPEKYGLATRDVVAAQSFIAKNVKVRECFLMAKDGEIIFETDLRRGAVYRGYSMTKTIGFLMMLMAASEGQLDIDADITTKYGLPSPKVYGVTSRMMMSMTLGGEHGPGELWRYDELGDLWMGMLPKVLYTATGRNATQWFQRLHSALGLSPKFTWPNVEKSWGYGASGTCEDWGRFAQLVLNNGYWGNTSVISPSFMQQAQEPVKYDPYQMYANPCYGLGWWLNPDKQKYNGCCWEASRLPAPNCNNETFIQGATHNLTFTLGLYGQVLLAIPERNVTIVSLGKDLRPIEPIRIGVYPGVCKMLGLPCSTPPKVPTPKCGETLECLGMSAQCYTGYGNWSHAEPVPGGPSCVACFQERVRDQAGHDPEAQAMITANCPVSNARVLSNFLECMCYDGDNVFAPWPTTTTTTPAPKPLPPVPRPYTTPAPRRPPACNVNASCWEALNNIRNKKNETKCVDEVKPGGCGICLGRHWFHKNPYRKDRTLEEAGCPMAKFDYQTVGLCLCGPLDPTLKECPTKIAGVCNSYHSDVTLTNNPREVEQGLGTPMVAGRRRRAYACTAPAGGSCEVGRAGLNLGEFIPDCSGYNETGTSQCFYTDGPSVRSADNKTNFRFWLNHTGREIVAWSGDGAGHPAGNTTRLAHSCGWHEQWSIVIDSNGAMYMYPSPDGLMCPSKDSSEGLKPLLV